jgi:hypothetical protein
MLRGVSYKWNLDLMKELGYKQKPVNEDDIGFIAQELHQILPEVVVNKNNKWFVKYDEIISICIGAIKEQSLILDESEKKLEKLETIAKEKGLI